MHLNYDQQFTANDLPADDNAMLLPALKYIDQYIDAIKLEEILVAIRLAATATFRLSIHQP